MSNSQSTLARPLALAGAVLIVGVVAWWGLSDGEPEASDPEYSESVGSAPSRSSRSGDRRSAPGEAVYREPEIYAPSAADHGSDGQDPEGSVGQGAPASEGVGAVVASASDPTSEEPAEPGAYDEVPTLGVEEPMHAIDPDAPPAQPQPSGNTAPSTPERELGRAIFVRGLLEGRLRDLNEQLEFAVAHGDEGAEARARRLIANLEEQRPSVEERVDVLQHGLSDGVTAPDER